MKDIARFEFLDRSVEELLEEFETYDFSDVKGYDSFSDIDIVEIGDTPQERQYFDVAYDDHEVVLKLLEETGLESGEYESKYQP